jgi:glycosyltransferase involved in cell wall biosynthesis
LHRQSIPQRWANRVRWLGFFDDQKAVSATYRNCDVLVLPSDFEPWAVVINEALAAGLAVVASDRVGAAADLVRHGVNGMIFPHGDAAALEDCLRTVTAPGTFESMKSAARTVLDDWRHEADPIDGLRRALRDAQVIPS